MNALGPGSLTIQSLSHTLQKRQVQTSLLCEDPTIANQILDLSHMLILKQNILSSLHELITKGVGHGYGHPPSTKEPSCREVALGHLLYEKGYPGINSKPSDLGTIQPP